MILEPALDHDQEMPDPQGHAIGFVDSQSQCDAIVRDLKAAGIPDSSIIVLNGQDGVVLMKRMMSGSLWGEESEEMLKHGEIELRNGHFVLAIETASREQALTIASLAARHGGHGFSHFGILTDERLTR